ncbi:MAG: hypothetical protein R3E32_23620 [Chitinophagales bacterium]
MDLTTILLGTFLTALCFIPFVWMSRNSKKIEKQLLQSLSDIAAQQNCKITQHELCGKIAVGLDENAHTFLFFKEGKSNQTAQHIDLDEIKNCTVVNTSRSVNNIGGNSRVIERLELSFLPISKNKAPFVLEFYNSEETMELSGELQFIEKWSKIINGQLKSSKRELVA